MITTKSFSLFAELQANNNKDWFQAHRDAIQEATILPLAALLEEATLALAATEMPLRGGKRTLFRINRDLRFTADKAPYKTQASGLLTPDGTKSPDQGVAYLQLDPKGGHMSAGYYNLKPAVLTRIRDRIVERPKQFAALLDQLGESGCALIREQTLTSMPRGYSQYAKEWFAEYVKLKVFLVRTRLSKEDWINGSVVRRFVGQTLACASLIRFGQSR